MDSPAFTHLHRQFVTVPYADFPTGRIFTGLAIMLNKIYQGLLKGKTYGSLSAKDLVVLAFESDVVNKIAAAIHSPPVILTDAFKSLAGTQILWFSHVGFYKIAQMVVAGTAGQEFDLDHDVVRLFFATKVPFHHHLTGIDSVLDVTASSPQGMDFGTTIYGHSVNAGYFTKEDIAVQIKDSNYVGMDFGISEGTRSVKKVKSTTSTTKDGNANVQLASTQPAVTTSTAHGKNNQSVAVNNNKRPNNVGGKPPQNGQSTSPTPSTPPVTTTITSYSNNNNNNNNNDKQGRKKIYQKTKKSSV